MIGPAVVDLVGQENRVPRFDEGLAHYYALDVPSDVANVQILDSEATPDLKIGAWPVKVRRRARHEGSNVP